MFDEHCGARMKVFAISMVFFICLMHKAATKETVVRAHVGTNVILPCRVDVNQCGALHSVKWYRDTSRIYVFSQVGQVARAEGDATERMNLEKNDTGVETFLRISPVEVEDEAIYKCEITYVEVGDNCDVVQIVKLITLVKPASVRILSNDGVSIANSTKLEAKNEGSEIEVICEAIGGKPIPQISWYNGSNIIKRASYSTHSEDNGVGTAVSKLQLTLSRGDLNARFECRVDSEALEEPITSWITVDVHVRPTKMEIDGVKGHVVQGRKVYLICDVFGARPAAKVRWYNGSEPITDPKLLEINVEENRDGTYTTKSSLIFTATRWENGQTFKCFAENEVTKSMLEPALSKLLLLDVRFPPVITVHATKTVVNETEKVMLSCTYFANPQKLLFATWLKDGKNFTRVEGKHEHGNVVGGPTMLINNISRADMGEYTCWLQNEVGAKESEETIYLDVHYPPDVEVVMEPSAPVRAVDKRNVTLECNVTSGNPPSLRRVRWFLGGELMTELPECNYTFGNDSAGGGGGGPFCGIDPSILSLIRVEETFAGNYTCQGENEAGYGPVSGPRELAVYYPPSPAKLRYYPLKVIKKASVTLECTVDRPGRPDNVSFMWYRGGHHLYDVTEGTLTIHQASLETRSNFTCIAMNEGGQSAPKTVFINVLAPPTAITSRIPYRGVLYSSKNVSLTCRIECFPLCSIIWFKDGYPLDTANNPLYYVNNTVHPPDYNKNDFESVESTLIWNITNWPNQQLDKGAPHSTYTCASRSKYDVGPAVNYSTEIAVDFPPEEVSVSAAQVDVIENQNSSPVKCSGKGRPKLSYVWKNNHTAETTTKDVLQLNKVSRAAAGRYVCEAFNKYGNQTAVVYVNVQYKPDCSISKVERDGSAVLVCTAHANPQEVSFSWRVSEFNETFSELFNFQNEGINSYVVLDASADTLRTYQCVANNSVGVSLPCEQKVAGSLPWYKRWGHEKLIIIIASIVILIVCVIIICFVIILLCRRKRENTKSPNQSTTADKMRLGPTPPGGGGSATGLLNDQDRGFYENLPFHGMQNPPNKPYRSELSDLDYADVDYKSYGPINYKAASIYAAMKRNKNTNKMEETDDLL